MSLYSLNPYAYKWQVAPPATPLHFGDMDVALDPSVMRAVQERLAWPLTYPPPYGASGVAQTLADYYMSKHEVEAAASSFWLGSSCLSQSYLSLAHLLAEGDEALYFSPAFHHIPSAIAAAGARPVPVDANTSPAILRAKLQAATTARTRLLYLVNPHNPTGRLLTREELGIIAAFAEENGLQVVSNELHSRILFDGTFTTFAALPHQSARQALVLSGASKSHNLAGLGGSFAYSLDAELLRAVQAASLHRAPEATSLQQAGLQAAYACDSPWLLATRERLREARDWTCRTLEEQLPRAAFARPDGTYFLWIDMAAYVGSASAADVIRQRCRVLVGDGAAFGASRAHVRLSLGLEVEELEGALQRMVRGLRETA